MHLVCVQHLAAPAMACSRQGSWLQTAPPFENPRVGPNKAAMHAQPSLGTTGCKGLWGTKACRSKEQRVVRVPAGRGVSGWDERQRRRCLGQWG